MNVAEWKELVCAARDLTDQQKNQRIYDYANAISAIICSLDERGQHQLRVAGIAHDHMVKTISLNAKLTKERR